MVLLSADRDLEQSNQEDRTSTSIILWDASDQPVDCPGTTYTWEGYSEENGSRSLYRYVETHAERLREKYLSWIHESVAGMAHYGS